jgi:hypothetical protein
MKASVYQKFDRQGREFAKPSPIGNSVDLGNDASGLQLAACYGDADRTLLLLHFARVKWIALKGLMIAGLEEHLVRGQKAYRYQEWWCCTEEETPK